MSPDLPWPGTPRQQSLLETIAALYASRDDILAVLVFGSLGRGTWDAYSDLDLAVVLREGVQVDVADEVERVRTAVAAHAEPVLITQVAGDDGYLILESLTGIAISYHPLPAMSPYVLEGWRVLCGSLEAADIRRAAAANDRAPLTPGQQVHRALWLALGVDIALQRRQFWRAMPGLERMRGALLAIYAAGRGGRRADLVFEEEAGAAMKAKFGRTFPQYFADPPADSIRSLSDALLTLMELLEQDLAELSQDQVQLGHGEREFVAQLRARQMALRNDSG